MKRRNFPYSLIITALAVAVYTAMAALTPTQLDDLEFMSIYLGFNGGSEHFSASALWDFHRVMWAEDNARLANFLSPVMNIISPWRQIYPLLAGLAAGALLLLVQKAGGASLRSWKAAALVWALMIVLLPWRDNLLVLDYSLNYIFGAALTLLYLILMSAEPERLPRAVRAAGLPLLGAAVGLWHEGFAATALAGIAAVAVHRRFRLGLPRYAAAALTAGGLLYLLTCPGTLHRAAADVAAPLSAMNWRVWLDSTSIILALLSFALFCLSARGRGRLRALAGDDTFLAVLVCGAAATLLSVGVRHSPRMSFWPGICGIIVLLRLWLPPLRRIAARHRAAAGVSAAALLAGCLLQSGMALCAQKRYFDESGEIMAEFRQGAHTVYRDVIQPRDPSKLTLYFPARTAWINCFNFHCLADYLGADYLAVVPTALEHLPAELDTISSPGAMYPVMRAGGALFTRWLPELDCHVNQPMTARFGTREEAVEYGVINFTTADGDSLALILPLRVGAAELTGLDLAGYRRKPQ